MSHFRSERELGVHLVNRSARTISLTEAGTRYAEFAARIIDEIDREEAQLKGLRDKAEGQLAIISPKWIGSNDVGDAIVAFPARYPKIHIRFEVGGMSERSGPAGTTPRSGSRSPRCPAPTRSSPSTWAGSGTPGGRPTGRARSNCRCSTGC